MEVEEVVLRLSRGCSLCKLGLYITTFLIRTRCYMQTVIYGWKWLGIRWCYHFSQGDRLVKLKPLLGTKTAERPIYVNSSWIGYRGAQASKNLYPRFVDI